MKNAFVSNLIKSYLTKFPKVPSLTLAKKIYAENNKTFTSVDAVRSCLRYYRGQKGEKTKAQLATREFLDQNIEFVMPESYAETFEPYEISQSRTLIISDLHIPYQDNDSIQKAINYGKEKKVNCILINGDLLDMCSISRFGRDWRQRQIHEEFEATRVFLNSLREHFPKAKIVYKYGNHDERYEKFLFLKAPEIFDCTDFQLEVLLKLGELKIEVVKEKRPIRIGKLTVLHGHELFGGSGGVNPARGTFLKTLSNVVVGHYHKTSSNTEASMYGDVFSVHSVGCLCGKTPYYMPINKWNTGFAYCELDIKTGNYTFYNLKIINGKIY
jgi:predicted phosphodiesterase